MQTTQESNPDVLEIDWRQPALVIGLGLAVFLTASLCEALPRGDDGNVVLWYTNGIPLAALLRTGRKQWPALIAASFVAIVLAGQFTHTPLVSSLFNAAISSGQFSLTAWLLRRRLGSYFDLTRIDHIYALAWLSAIISTVQLLFLVPLVIFMNAPISLTLVSLTAWYMTSLLSTLVLGVPLLALTSAPETRVAQPDRWGVARLSLLLLVLTAILTLSFGPFKLPGVFVTMPVLMLLGWRYGLRGAGLGNMLTVILVTAFTYDQLGADTILSRAGYAASLRGIYLDLFFSVCLLTSLPLAIARARQIALTNELAQALEAARNRALELAESEAKARSAAVQASKARERLRRVIETSSDIICTLDAQGRFIEISENCEAIWGWPREVLLNRYCFDFMHPDDRDKSIQLYERRKAGFPQKTPQNHYLRPDGSTVPMSWGVTWITEENVAHCVGRDMSEHNALEAKVNAAHRMEAVGQLTGGVAHDFNNLLTVVIGSCESAVMELEPSHSRRLIELALKAGQQCAELTRQLLAYARRQPLAPSAFDPNTLLDDSATLIARTLGDGLEFTIRKSSDLRIAFADPLLTETAILNLCLNARDAMPHGGKLVIETANATLTEDDVQQHPDALIGEYVMISVSDTGTGIPQDIIDRIFEPFFTTKEVGQGTGLGLSMVYGFIKQSNGHISLTSVVGAGTTVRLYLPVTTAEANQIARTEQAVQPIKTGREVVLLVEDHDLLREHAQCKLESLGYRVTVACNGLEALKILEQRNDIDLLFTDVVMPGGINGLDLGEQAAERWPDIRILYTTGYAQDALTMEGELKEGAALLPKPYSKSQLSLKIREVLDR